MEFDLYKDIQKRTNGEIYIGVVGPVRTGKSTFIKRFMDLFVLPYIEDEEEKKRTLDELPQSAAGKTIMTTEPKFIPQEAAEITLADESSVSVRLIDCVGFMVEGANGHLEGDGYRMVHTPWFEEEIPFSDAARIGTEKVIKDHATIGIVVTTDGSIGELPRENYVEAEQTAVEKLKEIGKPYVIVLNSVRPYSSETLALKESLEQEYQAVVVPVNCQQMHREDLVTVMKAILFEFPVTRVDFAIPKWTEMLPMEHKLKAAMIQTASRLMDGIGRVRDAAAVLAGQEWVKSANEQMGEEVFRDIQLQTADLSNGTVTIRMETTEQCYFSYISEMTGMQIEGEYQMISMLRSLSRMKKEYERVEDAMAAVEQKGYGVVMPGLSDIRMEDPVLIQHAGKYGVKMRAISPSIHMIKADIETEIAPIVGSEEQANDLIAYIREGEESKEGIWTTNIFGKSVGELMEDGIRSKILQMDDECQLKLQDTMQKIVNDKIFESMNVTVKEMPIEEAKKLGAMALFGEKYGKVVRVVDIEGWSTEFCGGTHVKNTAQIGGFKIVSESSVAAGIRRIEAVTGRNLLIRANMQEAMLHTVANTLKANNVAALPARAEAVMAENKAMSKELEDIKARVAASKVTSLFDNAETVGGVKIASAYFTGTSGDTLRGMCDTIRDNAKAAAVAVLVGKSDDKITMAVTVTKDAQAKGLKAGNLVKEISAIAGGKGGGKPDFAMAGLKDETKIDEALAAVKSIVEKQLG